MTVGKLLDLLISYDEKEKVEVEIYDQKTGKYLAIDENPVVNKDAFDLVFRVRA